jgi:hypothetical protein
MSRSFWRAAVIVRLALLAAAWPVLAHAAAMDDAVDAVATVGRIAGIPITAADKPTVKALITCSINGGQMLDCARQIVIDQLPLRAQPVAQCMQLGIRFDDCASPEQSRHVPVSARALLRCIGERSAIGSCAALVAIHPQQRQVLQVIDKLQADARYDLQPAPPSAMRHLIGLTEAIRDGDWEQVARYGGPEIHRVAMKNIAKARARVA